MRELFSVKQEKRMAQVNKVGRVLCVDYGRKRMGFALSDAERLLVTPLPMLLNRPPQIWQQLDALLCQYTVTQILLGYPSTADGQKIPLHNEIENFLAFLQKRYPAIELKIIDEAYSSLRAQDLLRNLDNRSRTSRQKRAKDKNKIDSVAAAFLLKQYLENPQAALTWKKEL